MLTASAETTGRRVTFKSWHEGPITEAGETEAATVKNRMEPMITFCIPTLNRTGCLRKSILSISRFCPVEYSIRVLSQGPPDGELVEFMAELDDRAELIVSPVNLGCGGGFRLLCEDVKSPFIMAVADDTYLMRDSIPYGLKAFHQCSRVGAVGFPHYDFKSGRMTTTGGGRMVFRQNGVVSTEPTKPDLNVDLMEVDYIDGAFLYRREMGGSFSWDPRMRVFEDYDRSLQIMRDGKWKQVIVPKGGVIHDHSWIGSNAKYETERFDGLGWRVAYRYFRGKWGLRFELRSHILYELVSPAVTLTRCQWLILTFSRFAFE
jgi:GT2 family glycosyltransferase